MQFFSPELQWQDQTFALGTCSKDDEFDKNILKEHSLLYCLHQQGYG